MCKRWIVRIRKQSRELFDPNSSTSSALKRDISVTLAESNF